MMMAKIPTVFQDFACDNCGACCRSLIIEARWSDLLREPRIYEFRLQQNPATDIGQLRNGGAVILYDAKTRACPFLDAETNLCEIYVSRPVECVCVEPGDAKCQQARRLRGLPLLTDRHGEPPPRSVLEASCSEYGIPISELD